VSHPVFFFIHHLIHPEIYHNPVFHQFYDQIDESTMQEAIDALNSHQFTSRRAAAHHFGVNRNTLGRQINGTLSRQQAHENKQSLSPKEEQLLLA
jgi:DNA-binding transcriptional regulator YhcF (GntR family)